MSHKRGGWSWWLRRSRGWWAAARPGRREPRKAVPQFDQLEDRTMPSAAAPPVLLVQPTPVLATEGAAFTGQVASFTDSAGGTAANYTAAITWGDGLKSAGTITIDSKGGFDVNGTTTYPDEGSYALSVTVTPTKAIGGSPVTASGQATVADAPLTATGTSINGVEGRSVSGTLASFTDGNAKATAADFTATIAWGDGQTSPGTVRANGPGFVVSGSHTYAEEGTYTTGLTIQDVGGSSANAGGKASIADAPLTASATSLSGVEGQQLSGPVATFTDGNPYASTGDFSATIAWGDGQTSAGVVSVNPAGPGFVVSGSHTYAEEGTYTTGLTIQDVGGSSANASGKATIKDAPLSAVGAPFSAVEAQPFSGVVATFTDANPYALAGDFRATITWGDGHTSTGTVSVNPAGPGFVVSGSHTYAKEGNYTARVAIRDKGGSTITATTTAAVQLAGAGNVITPVEGQAFSGVVATFTDAKPAGPVTDFTATITWGDGGTSAGTVAALGGGKFSLSGSHTYAEEGKYTIGVQVKDKSGSITTLSSSAVVADAPLRSGSPTSLLSVEGQPVGGVVATFTDANPLASSSDFGTLIDWGDNQTSVGVVSPNPNGPGFVVTGTHTYIYEGNYPITLTIDDDGGSSTDADSTANVADAPLSAAGTSLTGTEGQQLGGVVATFTDGNPNARLSDFSATISWGDNQSSAGTVSANPNGPGFIVSGSHTYADEGNYPISVSIQDVGGSSTSANSSAEIADAPLSPSGIGLNGVEGQQLSGTIATFDDANPSAPASDFTATIDWGDGVQSPGTVQADPNGGFVVVAEHTYDEEGFYPVAVSITDVGGMTATANSTADVADAPLTATGTTFNLIEGQTYNGVVATFTDEYLNAPLSDFSATIDWGDGNQSEGTVSADGDGGFVVSGTNTYQDFGTYPVSVAINDVDGSTATASTTANVTDAPLSATGTAIGAVAGEEFTGTVASFTDENLVGNPGDLTAVITWGDGGTSDGVVSATGPGSFTVSGVYTYAAPGSYPLSVQILDAGGSSVTADGSARVLVQAPTARDASYRVLHDQTFDADAPGVLTGATESSDDPLTAVPGSLPTHGTLVLNTDGSFTYTPTPGYVGPDQFTYRAADGAVLSAPATVTLTVYDHAPAALGAAYSVTHDQTLTVDAADGLLANGLDADGDTLTAHLGSVLPAHGSVTINPDDGSFTYVPDARFVGTDQFTYYVNDGAEDSLPATVVVTVLDQAPIATPLSYVYSSGQLVGPYPGSILTLEQEGVPPFGGESSLPGGNAPDAVVASAVHPAAVFAGPAPDTIFGGSGNDGVLSGASDADGDPLTASLVSDAAHGHVILNSDGTFTYTPAPAFLDEVDQNGYGVDWFVYQASDGVEVSNPVAIGILVEGEGSVSAAVINPGAPGSASPGYSETGTWLTGFGGWVSPADRFASAVGTASAPTATATWEADGLAPGTYDVSVNWSFDPVIGVDDAPYQIFDGNTLLATVPVSQMAQFSGSADLGDYAIGSGTLRVILSNNAWSPAVPTGNGIDTGSGFTIPVVVAGTLTVSSVSSFVAAATVAPAVNSSTLYVPDLTADTPENSALDIPVDALGLGGLTPININGPQHGTLTANTDGSYTYMPNPGFIGVDEISGQFTDGTNVSNVATAAITVTPVDFAPQARGAAFALEQDTSLDLTEAQLQDSATDPDGQPLSIAVLSQPEDGTLTSDGAGGYTYTPEDGFLGSDTFTYEAVNAEGNVSNEATVVLTAYTLNQPPVANDDNYATQPNSTLTTGPLNGVLANDTDPENDPLTAVLVKGQGVSHGTLTFNSDGTFTYIPQPGFIGQDSFKYQAFDGTSFSKVATVTIDVTPNAPPTGGSQFLINGFIATDPAAGGSLTIQVAPDGNSFGVQWTSSDSLFGVLDTANLQPPDEQILPPANGNAGELIFTVTENSWTYHGDITLGQNETGVLDIDSDGLSEQYTLDPKYSIPGALPSDAQMEVLAKDTAYVTTLQVGQQVPGLGYRVVKLFNNVKDGFQAVGLDCGTAAPPILVLRGTEPDQILDLLSDVNPNGVGYTQFDDNVNDVSQWLAAETQSTRFAPALTGHSLGGALAQWFAAAYTAAAPQNKLTEVVTFNAAGISQAWAQQFVPGQVCRGGVRHYIDSGDIVSLVGESFIAGSWTLDTSIFGNPLNQINPLAHHTYPMLAATIAGKAKPLVIPVTFSTVSWLNSPFFCYVTPDYYAMLTAASYIPGLGSLTPYLVFRSTTEAVRKGIGNLLLSTGITNLLQNIAPIISAIQAGQNINVQLPTIPLTFANVLQLQIANAAVNYNAARNLLYIQGQVNLTAPITATADFTGNNYIAIGDGGLNMVGTLTIPTVTVAPGWELDNLQLSVNTTTQTISASGQMAMGPAVSYSIPFVGAFQGHVVDTSFSGTLSAAGLSAQSEVSVLGGLSQEEVAWAVDFNRETFSAAGTFRLLGGGIVTSGSLTVDSSFAVNMTGSAAVVVPAGVPGIGGTTLQGASFALQFGPSLPLAQDFIAASTSTLLGQVGFVLYFNGTISLL